MKNRIRPPVRALSLENTSLSASQNWAESQIGTGRRANRRSMGERLGHQGPDQGFMLRLARRLAGKLTLPPVQHERDTLAGARPWP